MSFEQAVIGNLEVDTINNEKPVKFVPIFKAYGSLPTAATTSIYETATSNNALSVVLNNASVICPALFEYNEDIDLSNFYSYRVIVSTNAVDPAANFQVQLYDVSCVGGGSGVFTFNGTAVTDTDISITSLSANDTVAVTGIFSPEALTNGHFYMFGILPSTTTAANSSVSFQITLYSGDVTA